MAEKIEAQDERLEAIAKNLDDAEKLLFSGLPLETRERIAASYSEIDSRQKNLFGCALDAMQQAVRQEIERGEG